MKVAVLVAVPVQVMRATEPWPQETAKRLTLAQLRLARDAKDWPRMDTLLDLLASLVGHAG